MTDLETSDFTCTFEVKYDNDNQPMIDVELRVDNIVMTVDKIHVSESDALRILAALEELRRADDAWQVSRGLK